MSSIYTIVPEEALWEGYDQQEQFMEMDLNGILMQVRMDANQKATIVRLLRCGLNDYLNPALAPGQEIAFMPILLNKQ
ncbi:YlzJ-like family protein [Paenibacillus pinistramenti]|uniref:YlzJ-like family protein n=1 Tax=Paenibacillus pinistramenti TaxID=1768003 RepID=UPI001108D218|nr:YlzJ-like family protein [Paenibacillus pinistramenti]